MICALTSLGFGVCAFAACLCHDYVGCGLLNALTGTSAIHHSHGTDKSKYTGGSVIGPVDHVLAHGVAVLSVWNVVPYGVLGAPVYACLAFGSGLYYTKLWTSSVYYRGHPMVPWHATMHVVSHCAILYGYGLKYLLA